MTILQCNARPIVEEATRILTVACILDARERAMQAGESELIASSSRHGLERILV